MINYEYNGQPNLICVSLKETIAELISTSDVSVAIHHLDLIVEETAAFLKINNCDIVGEQTVGLMAAIVEDV